MGHDTLARVQRATSIRASPAADQLATRRARICSRRKARSQWTNPIAEEIGGARRLSRELTCRRRGHRRLAALSLFSIRTIAVPVVPRIVEMSIRRHLHGDATGARLSVTAIAFPSWPVRRIDEISVRRNLDDHARVANGAVASIAAPGG